MLFFLSIRSKGQRQKTKLDKENREVRYFIYKNTKDESIVFFLSQFKKDAFKVLSKAAEYIFKNENGEVNIFDFLKECELPNQSLRRVELLLSTWIRMGVLKLNAPIMPSAVEMYLQDNAPLDIKEKDAELYADFIETINLKKLRLAVLESFSVIPTKHHDTFIKAYFKCAGSGEVVDLIAQYNPNSSVISEFREEALVNAYDGLNVYQKAIFDFPLDENLNVIAGPGSGKTHTLITRVARLIQRENVPTRNILILAYNRSVVQELRSRIKDLFTKLGYRSITRDLTISTFHGYIKSRLGTRTKEAENFFSKDSKFVTWEKYFIHLANTEPGFINQSVGNLRYILVDEFQDITDRRLKILESIVNPKVTKLTVIGDPIQSIYGYERIDQGGTRSPASYYTTFYKLFSPKILKLPINYRSYQSIVDHAEEQLADQIKEFEMVSLKM